jgi:predicted unusual protein kinase regulating ubiquinone biosynthesis (AarF/ABC1/UbiB family)
MLKSIYFVFDVVFILIYDYLIFLMNNDYKQFIKNLASDLSKKNMLYVKMFQAISLNNNLIDNTINTELLKYTDCVPYSDDDIDKELMDDMSKHFQITLTKPINSGMISLVYKTQYHDKSVIVKIKRKNIDKKFNDAIEKIMFLIKILSYIPQFNFLDIPNIVSKNIVLLIEQLDFTKEVANTIEMKENYKNLKYIKIPSIYKNVTKMYPNAIMMDFIEGDHITKINNDDFNEYAKLVIKYGFVSIINNSATHGDLHAGNIIFIKNKTSPIYQLGLIDFGVVTKLNKKITNLVLNIAMNLSTASSINLSKKILPQIIEPTELFLKIPEEDKKIIYSEIGKIIEESIRDSKNADQTKIIKGLKRIKHFFYDKKMYDFYINSDFIKVQMASAMTQGVALHLCKNDYIPFANQVLDELFHIDLIKY